MDLITADNMLALLALTALEIVLGIDNIVFIAILTGKLPAEQRPLARKLGLLFAMLTRILLLLCISWVMGLTDPLFKLIDHAFSGRDIVLFLGGLFLIAKATFEIHDKIEGVGASSSKRAAKSFISAVIQIGILDVVFSLDSVITAVGMAEEIWVMIAAIVCAIGVMFLFADAVSEFIERHPTIKILGLAFLLLIGVMLVAEGFGKHINKGYIYFAMGFSLLVELLNLRVIGEALSGDQDSP
ncbi:MAG: TerC family protein [Bdellovibrionales bacterium]|nr:TerC family protein [Bdellovibrionales bacterium]